ncbi:MAG: ATP synthase F1 subunit delta [Acidobacteria bacterium]|nr:ATP synthase F1 subunit delta [Acidobacteriota bacterium]MYK89118.1 ATP synthase F1 subunit delta [Acidobacteriota bacterium]
MTEQAAANRYARALFEVSLDSGDPRRTDGDVAAFQQLVDGHPILARVVRNRAISTVAKRAVVEAILDRTPKTSPVARRLLLMLAERGRLHLLPMLLAAYRDRLTAHLGIVRARVTTAAPLDARRVASITERLKAATGRQVTLETAVDESLVGGMVTRIGGTIFDGSLAHHLDRLRQRFMTA